ncbi:retron St85 family effector protein [Gluconobacter frateurii]|uniref:retron St85 family effector protein n=1 Tax=Gluconobacter frateurii TaxID=38308 RepID=UPI001F05EB94|nr:retron St85 family effector protein [Gluconobacter frateurii]UMM09623.1 retron St85 family effector protein [Gluconobacter frateurii]
MNSIHVDYPSPNIFLCGGPYDPNNKKILSMRGAFYSDCHVSPFDEYNIIIAENVSKEFQARQDTYDNLLSLESDLAQLSSIILLFSESFGSAAELGAFCWDKDISKRLLVIISARHHDETSFVKLGPLQHLRNLHGEKSVCVIPRELCDINNLNNNKEDARKSLLWYIRKSFNERLETISTKTTLNRRYKGHIILFLVGIIWHYHALDIDELHYIALECDFSVENEDIQKAMFCAIQFGWILQISVGSRFFYVIKSEKNPLSFRRKNLSFSAREWKVDVLKFWEQADRQRYDAIKGARRR